MDNTNDNNTINPSEKTQLDPCACRRKGAKLEVYDWLSDIPESHDDTDLVEVRFKNTRKGYYRNTTHIKLAPGDLVAVEASPGHVSVKPNLFPPPEKDWHGKPAQQMSKSGISFSLTCVISPFINSLG